MSYDSVSFFTGYAAGLRARGYTTRPGMGFAGFSTQTRTDFYTWAAANTGASIYDSAAAYQAFAERLPAASVDTDGFLYWSPNVVMIYLNGNSSSESALRYVYRNAVWGDTSYILSYNSDKDPPGALGYFNMDTFSGVIKPESGMSYTQYNYYKYVHTVQTGVIPATGSYSLLSRKQAQYTWSTGTLITTGTQKGQLKNMVTDSAVENSTAESAVFYTAGNTFTRYYQTAVLPVSNDNSTVGKVAEVSFSIYPPVYKVEVLSGSYQSGSDYGTTGRAGNIRGTFSLSDDNMTPSTRRYIVNETEKIIYNPATEQETAFTDWTYNYMTRTYVCTLANSGTVTVTFGDSDVSMVSSANPSQTYTFYYQL